jgi:hypothetical protein
MMMTFVVQQICAPQLSRRMNAKHTGGIQKGHPSVLWDEYSILASSWNNGLAETCMVDSDYRVTRLGYSFKSVAGLVNIRLYLPISCPHTPRTDLRERTEGTQYGLGSSQVEQNLEASKVPRS